MPFHRLRAGIINNRSINKESKLRELRYIKMANQYPSFQESYIKINFSDFEQSTLLNLDGAVNQLSNNDVKAVIEGKFVC